MNFDILSIIGIISGIVAFSSYCFYIPSIIRGETRPNRASWWIWGLIGALVFVSYYVSGARETIWVPLSEAIGPILIGILSIKYGEGGWTRLDKWCLGGALGGTFLWWFTASPVVGLVAYLIVDLLAVIPTVRKSFYRPERENKMAWGLAFGGQFINLFAVEKFVFEILVYPIYMIFSTGTIFGLLFRKQGNPAFSSIDIVSQCLVDEERTQKFEQAISQTVHPGHTVLEVGTGSAIMSLFAARAGAKRVISIEYDPFIAKQAERVVKENNFQKIIEIRVANGADYEFEPGLSFDVVIMEMLTTGLIDEYQVPAINNLHRHRAITKNTIFLPYRHDTYASFGSFNWNTYGFSVPFTRHLWNFHKPHMREYEMLTDDALLNSIDFRKTNPLYFKTELTYTAKKSGEINALYLRSVTHITKNITVADTDALNGPVAIPVDPLKLEAGDTVKARIGYAFGEGYERVTVQLEKLA